MRDIFSKVMTGSMIAGAALLVAACGGGSETNTAETNGMGGGELTNTLPADGGLGMDNGMGTDMNGSMGSDMNGSMGSDMNSAGTSTDMNGSMGATGGNMTETNGM